MKKITKQRLVEIIIKAMPYPNQIGDWDFESEKNAVRFSWMQNRFRVELNSFSTEEVSGIALIGSDMATLVQALIEGVEL